MILPTSTDSLASDAPQIKMQISSLHDSAVAWAEAGYRVKFLEPGTKRPVVRGGGTRDLRVIDLKCENYPDAGLGINLDGSGLVVLDIDGPEGEVSLARLVEQAGVELPETYRVTSGRGWHLYLRLPEGCPPLVTQYGSQRQRPMLDIKFSGLMVVPPTLHKSGRRYQGSRDQLPRPPDLPEMPRSLYEVLARQGRPRGDRRTSKKPVAERPATPVTPDSSMAANLVDLPPTKLALLYDCSDGRNARIFRAVRRLVERCLGDDTIIDLVLASPIGRKAYESGNPRRYVQDKINAARRMVDGAFDPDWDASAFWVAAHGAGLGASHTRVLDVLLASAHVTGVVSRSIGRLALASAMSEGAARSAVMDLLAGGWLTVLREHDPKTRTPRTFGLNGPWKPQIARAEHRDSPPTHRTPQWLSRPPDLRFATDLDAFRPRSIDRRVPTLHTAYPLMCLLGDTAISTFDVARLWGCSVDKVQRDMRVLEDAGVALKESAGYRLTTGAAWAPARPSIGSVRHFGTRQRGVGEAPPEVSRGRRVSKEHEDERNRRLVGDPDQEHDPTPPGTAAPAAGTGMDACRWDHPRVGRAAGGAA